MSPVVNSQSVRKLMELISSSSCPLKTLSVNPSLSVIVKDVLVATESETGMFMETLPFPKLYSPTVRSLFISNPSVEGRLLITFMAPPVEFCPKSVP